MTIAPSLRITDDGWAGPMPRDNRPSAAPAARARTSAVVALRPETGERAGAGAVDSLRHGTLPSLQPSPPLPPGALAAWAALQPTHRRRQRWFEANPGCFARTVVAAVALAGLGGTAAWAAWRVKGAFVAARAGHRAWRLLRRRRAA